MTRTILKSTKSNLQDIYKNHELIEVIELPDNFIQDHYKSSDYQVKIKNSSDECELLANKKDDENDGYKWAIKVNSGDIETFKNALKNENISIIED